MSELRRLTLADISKLGDKETIPSFKARIEKLEKTINSPEDSVNEWQLQIIHVQDATGKSKVKVWNHDLFTESDIGEERLFECSDKGKGLSGIKVEIEEFTYKKGPKTGTKGTSRAIAVERQ